jgi:hypothetical protein
VTRTAGGRARQRGRPLGRQGLHEAKVLGRLQSSRQRAKLVILFCPACLWALALLTVS